MNMAAVFGGRDGVVLTDEPELADWLRGQGVPAATFDGVLSGRRKPPPCVIAVPLDYARLPSRLRLREILGESSVLWISLASFSGDPAEARYALGRFADIDIPEAVAMNRRMISRLLLAERELTMRGPGTDLTITLPDVLQLSSRTRAELLPDEHSTIGNYFEVAMSPTDIAGKIDTELTVSGTLRVDSVLVARHRELRGARADKFAAALDVAAKMREACPLHLTIEDNRFVDGFGPFAAGVHDASGPEYGGAVTEVAIGTGLLAPDRLDWSLNCLLNEGAAGIHLGLGNGLSGMHFDFISTEARLAAR